MRICTKCNESKELTQFRTKPKKARNSDKVYMYISSHCAECERALRKSARTKEYRAEYKARKKLENPVLFHMQERISQWRNKDSSSDLTVEFLVNLWESQKGLCYYSNEPMILGNKKVRIWESASLDRMTPELGYNQGNVVWCTYRTNSMKGNFTRDEFILICETIANKCKQ